MKDSFITFCPTYTHGRHSTTKDNSPKSRDDWVHHRVDLLGNNIYHISHEYTHKTDNIKEYAVAMAKVINMKRIYKAWSLILLGLI